MLWMVLLFVSWNTYQPAKSILNEIYNLVRKNYSTISQYLVKKSQLLGDESSRLRGGLSKKGSNIYDSDISETKYILDT